MDFESLIRGYYDIDDARAASARAQAETVALNTIGQTLQKLDDQHGEKAVRAVLHVLRSFIFENC